MAQLADPAVAIQINLAATVSIPHKHGRHARDNVIIVDISVVVQIHIIDVPFVAHARAAKRIELFGGALDM